MLMDDLKAWVAALAALGSAIASVVTALAARRSADAAQRSAVAAQASLEAGRQAAEVTKNIFRRQGIIDLHRVWQDVNDIDPKSLVGPDVIKAINALDLT